MLDFDWDNIDDSNNNDDDLLADPALLEILVPLPEWPPYTDPDLPAPSQLADQENAVLVPSTLPIGNGLFSKEFIRAGSQIVHFCGTELPNREAVQRARTELR